MYDLDYWDDADDVLGDLEHDPAKAPLLRAVDRALVRLAEDPFSWHLGTKAFMTPELRGISATPVHFGDWYIFWQRGERRIIEIVAIAELQI